jgi:ubiquinone/menaquinone biosynthesis C-methylase UbiE
MVKGPMDEQRVAQFYDEVGSSYDRTLYFLACDPLYEAEIARLSAGRRFRRVLDLGCGTGKQTALLAPRAEEVWAIDLSAESLRQAEARCARAGFYNVKFLQQSIVALPAEDGSVDAIFSYGDVISHVHDAYRQVFAESARVLARGGVMAFEVDGKWELDMLLHHSEERARAWAARGVGHLRIWRDIPCKTFTGPELAGILREVGLRVIRTRGVNIFHCLLPESILFGLPHAVRAGWRLVSAVMQRVDAAVGTVPGFPRLASTWLVAAVKD